MDAHFTNCSEQVHAPLIHMAEGVGKFFQGMQNIITCILGVRSHWTLEQEHGKSEN